MSVLPRSAKGAPFSRGTTPSVGSNFTDDIICLEWLNEVGMGQYIETFTVNFSVGGNLLSRKRLSKVRLQDFSKMNIENFVHQKILMNHIRHTLRYAYMNPERQSSFFASYGDDLTNIRIKRQR
jgi:hypothetical protein